MDDLISRHAAIDAVKECAYEIDGYYCTYDKVICEDDAIEAINILPSAEPERKTGKWLDEGFYADGHGVHAFRCSECGGHIIEYDPDPFCKWCGADMRGKTDEKT